MRIYKFTFKKFFSFFLIAIMIIITIPPVYAQNPSNPEPVREANSETSINFIPGDLMLVKVPSFYMYSSENPRDVTSISISPQIKSDKTLENQLEIADFRGVQDGWKITVNLTSFDLYDNMLQESPSRKNAIRNANFILDAPKMTPIGESMPTDQDKIPVGNSVSIVPGVSTPQEILSVKKANGSTKWSATIPNAKMTVSSQPGLPGYGLYVARLLWNLEATP